MGRVVNPEGSGKQRTFLTRSIVVAIQELMRQTQVNDQTLDLVAFIVLALEQINGTVETSVEAWEKRGYWLKADRFRLEWEWTGQLAGKLRRAIYAEDWDAVAVSAVEIGGRLKNVQVPKRRPKVEPWTGAWNRLCLVDRPK